MQTYNTKMAFSIETFIAYNSMCMYYFLIEESTAYYNHNKSYFTKQSVSQNINNIRKYYNLSLSLFSWIIFFATLYENKNNLTAYDLTCRHQNNSWINVMLYLKYIEWCDTIFLILKNKKISTLHYYHHMIVPFFMFIHTGENTAGQTYVMLSNSFAHGLMYLYYAYPVPLKKYAKTITFVQTTQHLGALALITNQLYNFNNPACLYQKNVIMFSLLAYAFFFYQFSKILLV